MQLSALAENDFHLELSYVDIFLQNNNPTLIAQLKVNLLNSGVEGHFH